MDNQPKPKPNLNIALLCRNMKFLIKKKDFYCHNIYGFALHVLQ